MYRGRSQDALSTARELLRLDPGGAVSQGFAAIVEATLDNPQSAIESGKGSYQLLPESPVAGSILAYAMARAQQHSEARALLESLAKVNTAGAPGAMACPAWLELGDSGRALEALEAGTALRCPWLPMILHDPRIELLRTEPLYKAIFKELFGRLPDT
jgi:predicted Zn-dependent protease